MRKLRVYLLLLLVGLLCGCHSMRLSGAAAGAGVKGRLKDVSPVLGTFQNASVSEFGPGKMRLWDLLRGNKSLHDRAIKGEDESALDDEVRIAIAGPELLEISLLSPGKNRKTTGVPYSLSGNYLHLRHGADFGWLPLGYRQSNYDLAITGNRDGDLVVLYRYEVSGVVMIVGNAGDAGTIELRFPRVSTPPTAVRREVP